MTFSGAVSASEHEVTRASVDLGCSRKSTPFPRAAKHLPTNRHHAAKSAYPVDVDHEARIRAAGQSISQAFRGKKEIDGRRKGNREKRGWFLRRLAQRFSKSGVPIDIPVTVQLAHDSRWAFATVMIPDGHELDDSQNHAPWMIVAYYFCHDLP